MKSGLKKKITFILNSVPKSSTVRPIMPKISHDFMCAILFRVTLKNEDLTDSLYLIQAYKLLVRWSQLVLFIRATTLQIINGKEIFVDSETVYFIL